MNVKQNLAILFYLKRKKATQDGKIPIYVRITIDGLRDEFSFGYKVSNDDWDDEAKRLLTSDPNHKVINKKIGQAQTDIERHFDLMQAKHGIATPQSVKESYLTPVNGADQHNQRMENLQLSESIDEMIFSYIAYCNKVEKASKDGKKPSAEKQQLLQIEKAELKKAIEKLAKKATVIFEDKNRQKTFILAVNEYMLHFMEMAFAGHRSPNTLEKWIGRKKRYLDFLRFKFKLADIFIEQLEYKFLSDLVKYLIVHHEVCENTAMKYAQCVKEIIDRAVTNGWIPANIFSIFQCKYTDPQHHWPALNEVEYLINYSFEKEILNEIRDIAVFQCFTGFSYQETYDVCPDDIFIGIDDKKWISRNRQKTGVEESVPLLPIPLNLIEKYKDHPKCSRTGHLLPVPTNEYYNRCLKEIAEETKSNVLNNTHQFRFFFANEVTYNKGVPLKTVSKMLGHKSVKTTEIYVRANKVNISENMDMVEKKLFDRDGNLKTENKPGSELKVVHIHWG